MILPCCPIVGEQNSKTSAIYRQLRIHDVVCSRNGKKEHSSQMIRITKERLIIMLHFVKMMNARGGFFGDAFYFVQEFRVVVMNIFG